MAAYAFAHLRRIDPHAEILDYVDRIDGTLTPFSGRFLVHAGRFELFEGAWPGQVVIIEFPSMDQARAWYDSAAYQAILPLRTRHVEADVILVEGVAPDYHASHMAAKMRAGSGTPESTAP